MLRLPIKNARHESFHPRLRARQCLRSSRGRRVTPFPPCRASALIIEFFSASFFSRCSSSEPRCQKARRNKSLEVIQFRLCCDGAFDKTANGVRRGVRWQARRLLNLHNDILNFVLPSERESEEANRMPRSNRHFGEQIRQLQHPNVTPLEQPQHSEKPNQLVGVGRVLENLTEIKGSPGSEANLPTDSGGPDWLS